MACEHCTNSSYLMRKAIRGHQRSSLYTLHVQAKREQRRTELSKIHLEQPGDAVDVVAARDERSGLGTLVELRAHRFHLVCIALRRQRRDPKRSEPFDGRQSAIIRGCHRQS